MPDRSFGRFTLLLFAFWGIWHAAPRAHAQAALLMEEPYGFFGTVNPTGHTAFYFERICADTPTRLRRCHSGEPGAVVSRYQGINGYDWVAVPLVPYLYAVNRQEQVPQQADRPTVTRLRNRYREQYLYALGDKLPPGDFFHGGWTQLVGVSYERRIYAFRFQTTEEQDNALIDELNETPNNSHFSLFYNNCADFARRILNLYFPDSFARSIFPDAGMTTPRQVAWKLVRYNHKYPQTDLKIFTIPQIPGYRHNSHSNKSVSQSLATTAYAVPLALVSPYLLGGVFADYVVRGRFQILPKVTEELTPQTLQNLNLSPWTVHSIRMDNTASAELTPNRSTKSTAQPETSTPPSVQ